MPDEAKELYRVGSTRRVLRELPAPVRLNVGHALRQVQNGLMPPDTKRLRGFTHAVIEIRIRYDKEAYRAVSNKESNIFRAEVAVFS